MATIPLRPTRSIAVATALGLLVAAGCGSDSASTAASSTTTTTVAPVIDPGDGGSYSPTIEPASFVTTIDNPYFPLAVGSKWVYEGAADDEPTKTEHVEVVVQPETKQIMGIPTTVVRDTVEVEGVVIEDTYDYYAQDSDGNVWYFGEDVKNYENGKLVDTEGSFLAGVDGALPGIVMEAHPAVGDAYRQEYYKGTAEDMGQVKSIGGDKTVPAGSYTDVLVTTDWNPLEPKVVEQKTYAKGVGVIYEEHAKGGTGDSALISFTPGA